MFDNIIKWKKKINCFKKILCTAASTKNLRTKMIMSLSDIDIKKTIY